jgi:hypothetical protein
VYTQHLVRARLAAAAAANVASCWLYLKEYINDARSHERQTEYFLRIYELLYLLRKVPLLLQMHVLHSLHC